MASTFDLLLAGLFQIINRQLQPDFICLLKTNIANAVDELEPNAVCRVLEVYHPIFGLVPAKRDVVAI